MIPFDAVERRAFVRALELDLSAAELWESSPLAPILIPRIGRDRWALFREKWRTPDATRTNLDDLKAYS